MNVAEIVFWVWLGGQGATVTWLFLRLSTLGVQPGDQFAWMTVQGGPDHSVRGFHVGRSGKEWVVRSRAGLLVLFVVFVLAFSAVWPVSVPQELGRNRDLRKAREVEQA